MDNSIEKEQILIKDHVKFNKDGSPRKPAGRKPANVLRALGKPNGRQKRQAGSPDKIQWTEKEKLNCVCVFSVCGNSRRTSELTHIPEATIRTWKQTDWWQELSERIVQEADEQLDTKLTSIVDKAVEALNDRLENGEEVYDIRSGKIIKKTVGAKDSAFIFATAVDKRQLLRGKATSRVEKVTVDTRLNRLAEQFKAFTNTKTIEGELVE
jgi:hypothetical protein